MKSRSSKFSPFQRRLNRSSSPVTFLSQSAFSDCFFCMWVKLEGTASEPLSCACGVRVGPHRFSFQPGLDQSNLFIGQFRRGSASLCFHSIGCTMSNMNKEKLMIYQCILRFHDHNVIIMKPKIYHSKNNIVILYIESLFNLRRFFTFS